MVLSNAQIKAILDGLTYPVAVRIRDSPPPKGRVVFPLIYIENVTPELTEEDIRIKQISQTFKIYLLYRVGGTAETELASVKQIQDVIRAGMQAAQLAGLKLFREVFNWSQIEYKDTPVRHVETFLTVTANDIQSESGQGLIGAYMTLTMAGKTVNVLAEDGDEGRVHSRPNDDTGNTVVVAETTTSTKFIEYEYNKSTFDAFAAAIAAKSAISATLTENANNRVMTVIPVRQRYNVRYDGLKTVILQLEIVSG
jgi:hypothetical protein